MSRWTRHPIGLAMLAAAVVGAQPASGQVTVVGIVHDLDATVVRRPFGGQREILSEEQSIPGEPVFDATVSAAMDLPGGTVRSIVGQTTIVEPFFIGVNLSCDLSGPDEPEANVTIDASGFTQLFTRLSFHAPARMTYRTLAFDANDGGFGGEIFNRTTGEITLLECFGSGCPITMDLDAGEHWLLFNATSSVAGTVGACACDGHAELTFVITIDPVNPCEVAGDPETVTIEDLLVYLDAWFIAEPVAERTGDGPASINVEDLLAFLDCWL